MTVNVEIIEFTAGKETSETRCRVGVQVTFSAPAMGHHIFSPPNFSFDRF